jgi:hypothetical protein
MFSGWRCIEFAGKTATDGLAEVLFALDQNVWICPSRSKSDARLL